jgi:hypothetical protein
LAGENRRGRTVGEQASALSPETKHHIDKAVDVLVEEFGYH